MLRYSLLLLDPRSVGKIRIELRVQEREISYRMQQYVPGLGDPDPSVVAFTTMIASLAVSELLDRLVHYGSTDPPSEVVLRLHDRKLSLRSGLGQPGHYCVDQGVWGRGDTEPFLGLLWV